MPERFLFQPMLLMALALPFTKGVDRVDAWKWVGAGLFALVVALGPVLEWSKGDSIIGSPLGWLLAGPELSRMHHPVRAALVAGPLLAVGVGLLLDRLPKDAVWVPLIAALFCGEKMAGAVPWGVEPTPPGTEAALWLADHGTAVVDATGPGGPALGLAPIHGLPMLEGLRELRPAPNRVGPGLRQGVDAWLRGERQPDLADRLAQAGFSHVLAVDRGGGVELSAIEADLGDPVRPGVYSINPSSSP
jgi:hypothetical protein